MRPEARPGVACAGLWPGGGALHDLLGQLAALAQVLLIDVTLAGDNAVVIGLAVSRLPPGQRSRAMLFGIGAATVLRIGLALVTLQLLAIIGLTFAGGLLLLWVCWRMLRELRGPRHGDARAQGPASPWKAIVQIVVADLSMSLDNVLAVAGAAHNVAWVLVVGLAVSVALTGLAAGLLLRLLDRARWVAWVGLAIVLYVAIEMIWSGWGEVGHWLRGVM